LKIKIIHPLITIDILTVVFLLSILFFPTGLMRVILGLPFILFFPGYSLIAALFSHPKSLGTLERWALSSILSIAAVGLIGIGLNFTSSGISELNILCAISGFILVFSTIGLGRQIIQLKSFRLFREYFIHLPSGRRALFTLSATPILLAAVIIAAGFLGYTVFASKDREKYTEFYVLGLYGKAYNYPAEFIMENHRTIRVNYDSGIDSTSGEWGQVSLGIINHEQQQAAYVVKIDVDGENADINLSGDTVTQLKPIELPPGGKWEGIIGFTSRHPGDNQKVEFLLFKDAAALPEESLQLWIKTSGE
jgi:uncharacterized membrane protein